MTEFPSSEAIEIVYKPAHRLAILSAIAHLLVCAGMAAYTQTWLLWLCVGVPAVIVPAWIALRYPVALASRLVMAAGFMVLTCLVIQQSRGDIEAHFSFFVMLSVLVIYCDWRPIVLALVVIVVHHLVFNVFQSMDVGFYVWNDQRNGWGHLGVHVLVGAVQAAALMSIAMMLRKRRILELENAALDRSLRHVHEEATRDVLTGLHNRRYLDRIIEELNNRDGSDPDPVVLCVVDLDRFKSINDRFGHPVGDEVLRAAAQTIQRGVGAADSAIRQGGEEFIVVLRGKTLAEGRHVAERLRTAIAAAPVPTNEGPVSVTASIGVAAWRSQEGFHDCYVRMDRALYLAKRNGRDRVLTEVDVIQDLAGGSMSAAA